jgi:hypothetical protein
MEVIVPELISIGAMLWPFVFGLLANDTDDRAPTFRFFDAAGLRATVRRLGVADRFFIAECLFITKLY